VVKKVSLLLYRGRGLLQESSPSGSEEERSSIFLKNDAVSENGLDCRRKALATGNLGLSPRPKAAQKGVRGVVADDQGLP